MVATGQLEYWDQGGRLSLIVHQLREEGEGDLHRRFERLKSDLEAAWILRSFGEVAVAHLSETDPDDHESGRGGPP